tara:strand:+ start:575 stop:1219 length:645 start_codon:yes stop_codon:yes gene_type:complete
MDDDIAAINSSTNTEKIKNYLNKNKKKILSIFLFLLMILILFFGYNEYKKSEKIKISNLYNSSTIDYSNNNKLETLNNLIDIINKKDSTYSPLSLYFIIDNDLTSDIEQINGLFDVLIKDTKLQKEIKNLIIYKKALFNADISKENELLEILKPIISSNSIWKSHALYLLAEYFYSKKEKEKSKEFFNQIINLDNANQELKINSQKRLQRDLSD